MENLKLLFQVYLRPGFAMSELIDRGSWIGAAFLVVIVAAAFYATVNARLDAAYRLPDLAEYYQPAFYGEGEAAEAGYRQAMADYREALTSRSQIPLVGDTFFRFASFAPTSFYQPLLSISLFYIPLLALLISWLSPLGSFGLLLRRDYGPLAVCSLTAWAAAHLPFAIAGIALNSQPVPPPAYLAIWAASGLLFVVFMMFAIRTVFGAGYAIAFVAATVGLLAFTLGMYIFQFVSPWLLSPLILFFLIFYFGGYLGGEARGFGNAFRQRQNFKRFLHTATVNPRDADAHVQLGLIYLQRRQEQKAREHFEKALAIDPAEVDANYEMGKLARTRGDLQEALNYFSVVVEQNDKHSLSEVWREIGATYLGAGMHKEAREALGRFVDRRAYDPEGLYYLGKVLKAEGDTLKAREAFEGAIDAVKNSPDYRRRAINHWSKLAQKEI